MHVLPDSDKSKPNDSKTIRTMLVFLKNRFFIYRSKWNWKQLFRANITAIISSSIKSNWCCKIHVDSSERTWLAESWASVTVTKLCIIHQYTWKRNWFGNSKAGFVSTRNIAASSLTRYTASSDNGSWKSLKHIEMKYSCSSFISHVRLVWCNARCVSMFFGGYCIMARSHSALPRVRGNAPLRCRVTCNAHAIIAWVSQAIYDFDPRSSQQPEYWWSRIKSRRAGYEPIKPEIITISFANTCVTFV